MKKIALLSLMLFLLVSPAMAAGNDAQALEKVEAYFQSLKTLKADFKQTAPDGEERTGIFYLSRPGKMRFDYAPPLEDFIVADGIFIYYYDGELKQQSNATIGSTMADYFLRKKINLSGDITVTDIRTDKKQLEVTVTQTADPAAGSLTMFFDKEPLTLRKWSVVDSQGLVTQVALSNIESGLKLDSALFRYRNPEGPSPNR